MGVSIDDIKRLKNLTGVGLTDAKKALVEVNGDFDKALDAMRKKGLTRAEKKGEREARQGIVDSYVHESRIGVLIELNCETDFVARTDDFKALAHDVAMHIAASAPEYISEEQISIEIRETKASEFKEKVISEGKPAEMADKIVEGMLNKYFSERCLLNQAYIKNPDQTINDLIKEHVAKLGENIIIRKMARVEIGQVN
jgi:elongation factor Ts